MRTQALRFTAAASAAALVLAAMLSCSSSGQGPADQANPPGGPAGGGPSEQRLPEIQAVSPSESCATAGNIITIEGDNLVDDDFLATVTINGVAASVQQRFDGGAGSTDVLTVATPALAVPASGLQVEVAVTNPQGTDRVAGAIRVFPGCDPSRPPMVVSASPSTGSRNGFEPVELTGDQLACITGVQFVSTTGTTVLAAEILSVTSDQSVTILTPANIDPSSAPYQIVVTSQCGTNAAPRPTFLFTGGGSGGGPTLPDATAIVDITTGLPQGPSVGGNPVRITGRDLGLATTITIGTTVLNRDDDDFVVTASGDIIIQGMPPSPLGASTTVGLSVIVASDEGADPTPVTYTYIGAGQPNCAGLTPNSGPLEGGTAVTITGQNLNDVDEVRFGGVAADAVFRPTSDGSRIVVVSPAFAVASAVDIDLRVTSGSSTSTVDTCNPVQFTYVDLNTDPPFSVNEMAPDAGPQSGGTTIVITGTGLDLVNSVTICGVAATITSALSEQVQATTGIFNGTVPALCDVVVTTADGLSATLVGVDGFTYRPVVPDAQAFAGDSARTAPQAGGTFFRLQGVNLIGVDTVRFGGAQNGALACELDVQSNTQVSGTVPAYLTPGAAFPASVTVVPASEAGVDSTPLTFTYYANPRITDARGPLGTDPIQANEDVLVLGNNFRPANDVFVDEIVITHESTATETATLRAGDFQVIDNGRIQFTFPASLQLEGYYDVTIKTPRQGADCVSDYSDTASRTLFLGTRPTTSTVTPSFGRWSGGTTVVIRGDFSIPVTFVTICGVQQFVDSQTDTTLTITTQSTGTEAAAGVPCDIVVSNISGDSDPIVGGYTFVRQPDIASVEVQTPNCGLVTSAAGVVPVTAGQLLTIRGSDFGFDPAGVNRVLIGGQEAIISATRTANTLSVFVPDAPATGGPRFPVVLEVRFVAAPGGTADASFTAQLPLAVDYLDVPTITSITPPSTSAGNIVTIAGTNLRNVDGTAPVVTFGASVATVLSSSDTSLQVIVPAGTPGSQVTVTVTTCQGSATSTFSYPCTVPVLGSFSPTTGAANDVVTITGTDLTEPNGAAPAVLFGTAPAVVETFSPTTLTVRVPSGTAGSRVNISVTTCGGTSTSLSQFVYQCSAPAITNITPGFGVAGTNVTLSGSFENAGATPTVFFGGAVASSIVSFSAAQIVAVAPPGTGTVDISVQTCGGTALQLGGFTYCLAPNATSVTPGSGAAGAPVLIGGTSLQDPNGTAPTVTFTSGAVSEEAVVVASSGTQIQVQAPAGVSGVATVIVTTCGGTDTAGTFRYCETPTITSVTPDVGAAGTQVTIVGTSLRGANGVDATIRFGGVAVTQVIQATDTQFIVIAPAGPSGQVVVDATTCGGTGQSTELFSYCALPVVNSILPTNGAAGDEVEIFGTDLVGANGNEGIVRFGTTQANVIAFAQDGTRLTAIAPTGFSQGQAVNVRVETCGGTSATNALTVFTYQTSTTCIAPTVTTLTPTAAAAGQQLTVSGTNLIGNNGTPGEVRFGATLATLIASTPTQLVVTIPPGTGTVGVSVTTCGGTAQSPQLFTYCVTPSLTAVTPGSGAGGSTVILTGTNLLGANGGSPVVTFGNSTANVVDQTATQLTVVAPSNIAAGTTVGVRVTTCGGASNSRNFQFVSTTQFDVTDVTPDAGPNTGGQIISITGTGLAGTGGSAVAGIQICDVNATFTVISDTLIQATTGAFGGAVPATCDVEITLVDLRQDTLVGGYQYLPPVPDGQTFDDVGGFTINSPQAGGVTFRILGTNLIGATDVNFGGFAGDPKACNLQVASDTELTGITPTYATPLGTTQSVGVFVESAAGVDPTTVEVAPSGSGILYRYHPNPTITGVAQPNMPNPLGSRTVTVFGSNFMVGDDVFLDPFIQVQNVGLTDPDNFPPGSQFDFDVPIFNITPTSFQFDFPGFSTGDLYSVTISTPNSGAPCVTAYFETQPLVFVAAEASCVNVADDDQDGLIDCNDPDCEGDAACP